MKQSRLALGISILMLLLVLGCSKQPSDQAAAQPASSDQTNATANGSQGSPTSGDKHSRSGESKSGEMAKAAQPIVIPSGTALTVRLDQAIGSKNSAPGTPFSASVATPVSVGGKVVIPSGAQASGSILDAAKAGRFAGGADLVLALDSIMLNGSKYQISTEPVARSGKGKGKRTAVMVGGGAGGGALIGGLVGGGKGAAIGALVGAGAGTAGAATKDANITLPVESALTFKLKEPVSVKAE